MYCISLMTVYKVPYKKLFDARPAKTMRKAACSRQGCIIMICVLCVRRLLRSLREPGFKDRRYLISE